MATQMDWLKNLASQLSWQFPRKANEMSALTLAYIGDAVWEVAIRMRVLQSGDNKPNQLHKKATTYVKAERQAFALHRLLPLLSGEETGIVRRGRNAKSATVPKHASITDYRHSTAFECLLGFLFITGQYERLHEVMNHSIVILENVDEKENKKV
ncbi:ribonuclease III [Fodinisporobacter ferrooxydans]|uniref:Mini-ribonuclease 3 n=1 Tax=Fodinisporobacter ferrooxydans TaxID=2901836 RepID=A0ABY4CN03_9BACL|nr:ribonuclease III [Alicyclobacillaceae bacterium MYW30-H2]